MPIQKVPLSLEYFSLFQLSHKKGVSMSPDILKLAATCYLIPGLK